MTKFGEFLAKRSVNKSDVSRKTGISKPRLSELTLKETTKIRADELYMISVAIGVNPSEMLEYVCGHLKEEVKE